MKYRVAVVSSTNPFDGGANNFEASFVETLNFVDKQNLEFIYFQTVKDRISNRYFGNKSKSSVQFIKLNIFTKLRIAAETSDFLSLLLPQIGLKFSRIEKTLLEQEIDAVTFLSPNALALCIHSIPIVTTVWDLGHREYPDFPEYIQDRSFQTREIYFKNVLPRSILTLVDSDVTSSNLEKIYNLDKKRISKIGLLPALPDSKPDLDSELEKFNLGEEFIFYPAQFWAHKNHHRLIAAFAKVSAKFPDLELVLTGSDKGLLSKVIASAEMLGVKRKVHYLGFVSRDEYLALLSSCAGLVFPSMIGPTNLPPLEAQMLGKRMALSELHEKTFDYAPKNATYFDPTSIDSIEKRIIEMLNLKDVSGIDFSSNKKSNVQNFVEKLSELLDNRNSLGILNS